MVSQLTKEGMGVYLYSRRARLKVAEKYAETMNRGRSANIDSVPWQMKMEIESLKAEIDALESALELKQ